MDFKELYKSDIFANEAGIVLNELDDNHAVMSVVVVPEHLNGGGFAHGGLIFTLTDIAMAAIANQVNPISVSLQSDIRFLGVAQEGDTLTADATCLFARKKLSNCRVSVTNQRGDLIAIAEGMYHTKYVKPAEQ